MIFLPNPTTQSIIVCFEFCLSIISTFTLFLYVELVNLKSFLTTRPFQFVLTCLICFISTILATTSLSSADVKQHTNNMIFHDLNTVCCVVTV